jgi:hypothetical protein
MDGDNGGIPYLIADIFELDRLETSILFREWEELSDEDLEYWYEVLLGINF